MRRGLNVHALKVIAPLAFIVGAAAVAFNLNFVLSAALGVLSGAVAAAVMRTRRR